MINLKEKLSYIFENEDNLKKYIITTLEQNVGGNIISDAYSKGNNNLSMSLSYPLGDEILRFELSYNDNNISLVFLGDNKNYELIDDNSPLNVMNKLVDTVNDNIKPRLQQEFS